MESISFESFGVTFSVGFEKPGSVGKIRERLEFVFGELIEFREVSEADQQFRIGVSTSGTIPVTNCLNDEIHHLDEDGFERFFEALVRNKVGEYASGYVFLHAGVVAVGEEALVLPGRTFSGKTTLVEALLRAGARYVSDEYAVLDEDALVHPFPKPLSMRNSAARGGTREVLPGEKAVRPAEGPLACRMVFFSEYRPDAVLDMHRLTSSEGLLRILEHALPIRRNTEFSLKVLNKLALRAIITQSYRADADEVAVRLINYFNRSVIDVPID